MWVADGNEATDGSSTEPKTTKTCQARPSRKIRFVGPNIRHRLDATTEEGPATSRGAHGAEGAIHDIATLANATGPIQPDSTLGRVSTVIDDAGNIAANEILGEAAPMMSEQPLQSSFQEVMPTITDIPDVRLPDDELPHLEFTHIPPDSLFSLTSDGLSTETFQTTTEEDVDAMDLNLMDIEEVCMSQTDLNAYDIQQQNIWSPLLDFIETPPALPMIQAMPKSSITIAKSHEELLNIYDSELCVLPLTSDASINPFRCQKETSRGSRLLFHSILALCYQHLFYQTKSWSDEVHRHKSQANNELAMALTRVSFNNPDLSLLDSILVMFTLDCTLSAAGSWTIHLKRAKTVIDSCGGPPALSNARLRSQAGMLLWWDACLALISRKGLVFDTDYVEFLLEHEESDQWSFYDLTGCPADIVRCVIELAELAKEFEIASSMRWVSFDLTAVWMIEDQLNDRISDKRPKSFASSNSTSPTTGTDNHAEESNRTQRMNDTLMDMEESSEEEINLADDQRHCIEAWRQALCIYIRRVFKLNDKTREAHSSQRQDRSNALYLDEIRHRAHYVGSNRYGTCSRRSSATRTHMPFFSLVRSTINDIRCVRRSSQTQKQLLLPAFIAGSETSDPELRRFICAYCDWWSNKSNYKMFDTVSKLLVQIWDEMDKPTPTVSTGMGSPGQASNPQQAATAPFAQTQTRGRTKGFPTPCWWGSIIDSNAETLSSEEPVQYLFG